MMMTKIFGASIFGAAVVIAGSALAQQTAALLPAPKFVGKTYDGRVDQSGGKLYLYVESVGTPDARGESPIKGSYGWLNGERGALSTISWSQAEGRYTIVYGSQKKATLHLYPPDAEGKIKGLSCPSGCWNVTFTPK